MRDDITRVEGRGYRVTGRVQGVGFRWFTRSEGRRLGLGGHVRNLPDGSVEVHARGPVLALEALERALLKGPPASRVSGVERIDLDPRTPADDFLVDRW
ncbi:MAG TPA: acylphosphatase [Longimicrobiales bacterium]|nr:acylphosphatase [Longimicrobiales bacterium]